MVLTQAFIDIFVAIVCFTREADRCTFIGLKLAPVNLVALCISKLLFTLP
jgi:hypothetical protein